LERFFQWWTTANSMKLSSGEGRIEFKVKKRVQVGLGSGTGCPTGAMAPATQEYIDAQCCGRFHLVSSSRLATCAMIEIMTSPIAGAYDAGHLTRFHLTA
jgi:hypothetical protein